MKDHYIAAHHVARHLRAIAELLPRLSAQGADPFYDLLETHGAHHPDGFRLAAANIEATAPFDPITPEQRDELTDAMAEQLADRSTREVVDDYIADWTEADWRIEWDEGEH